MRIGDTGAASAEPRIRPVLAWLAIPAVVWVAGYAIATAMLQGSEVGLRILADVAYLLPYPDG